MPRACAPTSIRTGVCSFFSPGNAKENIPESVSSNSISFSASQVRIVSRCCVFASACCAILVLPHHECGLPIDIQGSVSGSLPGDDEGLYAIGSAASSERVGQYVSISVVGDY